MNDEAGNGSRVTFTVKELLGDMNKKLDALIVAVADKIGRAEFEALKLVVLQLQQDSSNSKAVSVDRRALFGLVVALVAALGALGWLIKG